MSLLYLPCPDHEGMLSFSQCFLSIYRDDNMIFVSHSINVYWFVEDKNIFASLEGNLSCNLWYACKVEFARILHNFAIKDIGKYFLLCFALLGFGTKITLTLQNQFVRVPSLSIIWNCLRNIAVISLNVWLHLTVQPLLVPGLFPGW